jgi:hypothetical protein
MAVRLAPWDKGDIWDFSTGVLSCCFLVRGEPSVLLKPGKGQRLLKFIPHWLNNHLVALGGYFDNFLKLTGALGD